MLSDDVIRKARRLLDRANRPDRPQAEAGAALAMDFQLTTKYGDSVTTQSRQTDTSVRESSRISLQFCYGE